MAAQLQEAARRRGRSKGYKLEKKTREAINRDLRKAGFDGNGRFRSISNALSHASNVLSKHGFEWGQVTSADLFRHRPSGTQMILIAKQTEDPFSPIEVANSALSFQWTELRKDHFEVVAYMG